MNLDPLRGKSSLLQWNDANKGRQKKQHN